MINLKGIEKYICENYSIFLFKELTQDIKNVIKEQLSSICHGTSYANSKEIMYSYESTLKEFIRRLENKDEDKRIGMIGEILVHLIIRYYFEDYLIISPFFNMEGRDVKKGYDIVLSDKEGKNIWILEVKSGVLHKDKDVNGTVCDLIDDAKNDLKKRFNKENFSLWQEAINNARVAIDDTSSIKEAIIKILITQGNYASREIYTSRDKNVFLSGVVFADFTDCITADVIKDKQNKISNKEIFNSVYIISIQKGIMDSVYDFIKNESNKC